MVDCGVAVQF